LYINRRFLKVGAVKQIYRFKPAQPETFFGFDKSFVEFAVGNPKETTYVKTQAVSFFNN